MVSAPNQNTVGVCKIIILLFLYYIGSRLLTLIKIIGGSIQVSDIFHLTASLKFISFSFQVFLILFLKRSLSFDVGKFVILTPLSLLS